MSDGAAALTPAGVAADFANALMRDDWTAVAAKLAPDATWLIAGKPPLVGVDDIVDRLREHVRKGSAPRLDGPLRVTRGSEVAWPSRERARITNDTNEASRVDIVDVDTVGRVRTWTPVPTGSPAVETEARAAYTLSLPDALPTDRKSVV